MFLTMTRPEEDETTEPRPLEETGPLAHVLPFSRLILGRGARHGTLPKSPDPQGEDSPVYLPGDPRLSE